MAGQQSLTIVTSLRLLRIKVFADHLHKITVTINRGSFTECSQTLAKQTNAKLNML